MDGVAQALAETFGIAGSKAVVYYYALPTQSTAATCQIATV